MNLRIPGPIPVSEDILEAMARPMINHRGPEYKEMLYRVTGRLKEVFQTGGDVYILTASGTGAMEAAVTNTMSPGERALCVSVGAFGDRFGQIAKIFGAEVTNLRSPSGQAVDVDRLREALRKQPDFKAVLVTHNETATGVTNDLRAIAGMVRGESDALLLVDGISSVASIPLETDSWGCDVVATASQKGWMAPPGLAFISFSERAWKAQAGAAMPRFYFDLALYRRYLDIGQPPFTPAISVVFAMDLALARLLDEGLGSVFERHASIGRMTRDGIRALGLSLLPDESVASNTVTAVKVPEGVDGAALLSRMREEHGVVLAGGQEELRGKIFRIGHMGECRPEDIQQVLDALEATLPTVGFRTSGVTRARG